jgi:hypothetical protein
MERYPQHEANMKAITDQRIIGMFSPAGRRAEALTQRFQGRSVFDPTVLSDEYRKTCALADFIGRNYAPLKAARGNLAPRVCWRLPHCCCSFGLGHRPGNLRFREDRCRGRTRESDSGNVMGSTIP